MNNDSKTNMINSVQVDNNIYEIERGVPIPPKLSHSNAPKYEILFGQLQVGDSIFLPDRRAFDRVNAASKKYQKLNSTITFAKRKMADGWRIWRIT